MVEYHFYSEKCKQENFHIMKLIYSVCKATNPKDYFSQKIVNTFKPEDYKISRLISRKEGISIKSKNYCNKK